MGLPRKLRSLLQDSTCNFILEAHSAVSARIAAEAGAPGLWASSLTLSCLLGLRDTSEITMTQALEILESITSIVDIPVLFDGDTGYGHLTHFQQLVRHLIRRNVGGVCIEDKIFPKRNSFIASESQELAPVEEFCAKIRAGKDTQTDPEFVIVARTEALITGLGMEAALSRSHRYADSGADAILIHSKAKTFAEVYEFARRWKGRLPLICVPTTYPNTTVQEFEDAGISLVIWANHMLRASVSAMKSAAQQIVEEHSVRSVEATISPVKELFRLQDADRTQFLDELYGIRSPQGGRRALILSSKPPALGKNHGFDPGVKKLLQVLRSENIRQITAIQTWPAPEAALHGVMTVDCSFLQKPRAVGMLHAAQDCLKGDVLVMDVDVLYSPPILHELLSSSAPITIVVDSGMEQCMRMLHRSRSVVVSDSALPCRYEKSYCLFEIGAHIRSSDRTGLWIGLIRWQNEGTEALRTAVNALMKCADGIYLDWDAILTYVMKELTLPVHVLYAQRGWEMNGQMVSSTMET